MIVEQGRHSTGRGQRGTPQAQRPQEQRFDNALRGHIFRDGEVQIVESNDGPDVGSQVIVAMRARRPG